MADQFGFDENPNPNSGNPSWEDPDPYEYEPPPPEPDPEAVEYEQAFDEGAWTASAEMVQAQEDLRQQREDAEAQERWQRELDAYQEHQGRGLSNAEAEYLIAAGHALHPEEYSNIVDLLETRRADLSKDELMLEAMAANDRANNPDAGIQFELAGPDENYGFDGTESRHERAEAKAAWILQQTQIRDGSLISYEEED